MDGLKSENPSKSIYKWMILIDFGVHPWIGTLQLFKRISADLRLSTVFAAQGFSHLCRASAEAACARCAERQDLWKKHQP